MAPDLLKVFRIPSKKNQSEKNQSETAINETKPQQTKVSVNRSTQKPSASKNDGEFYRTIKVQYPNYDTLSVLGRLFERAIRSNDPLGTLDTIQAFTDLLDKNELEQLTKVPIDTIYQKKDEGLKALSLQELQVLEEYFSAGSVKTFCFLPNGTIKAEHYSGELEILPFEITLGTFNLFTRACSFGIPGQTIHPVVFETLNYRMVYSYNGWKESKNPCILLKNLLSKWDFLLKRFSF